MESSSEPQTRYRISRRGFIIGTGVAVAAVGVTGYASIPVLRDELRPELDPDGPTGLLDPEDSRTLMALVEVLIPERYRQDPDRLRGVLDGATREVRGLLSEYRSGVRLLDGAASRRFDAPFASIAISERDSILAHLLWRYAAEDASDLAGTIIKLRRRAERAWHDESTRRFRELVVRDLLYRVYVEAVPSLIGYSNLPGVAGNPRDYVNAPGS